MKKTSLFYFIILAVLVVGCNQTIDNKQTIDFPVKKKPNADWLIGNWKYEDEDGTLHEDWSRKNDTVFIGESYFIEKNDTLFFEYLRLTLNGDSVFYESLGEDKINPKVKTFTGLYVDEDQFQLENLQLSFPRKMCYNQLNDTLMIIEVSGFIDGSEETQPYQMVRINQPDN